MKPDTV